MNKTRRLFVGIPLSSAFRKRLTQEQTTWPKEAVILTAPENLHITLFFLGFVREEEVANVCLQVSEACKSIESFELTFNEIKLMDSPDAPKMIWLSGEPSDALRILRETIEKAFSSFITEKKSYRPHVTLAKIKKSQWLKLDKKPRLKEKLLLIEPVDTVAVFESLSLDGKRCYEQIDTFSLL